jgi:integrase
MKGHIRERGTGNWYAVLDERDPATGKRKRKWHKLDAMTKRKAQDALADLISGKKHGTYVAPDKTILIEFLERWLTNIKPNVAPRTHERYAEIVRKNIVPLLGGVTLSKLRPDMITAAYAKAQSEGTTGRGPLSPQSVVHMHRVLKQALGPVRWERLHRNSEDHVVKPPKVERCQLNILDMAQTLGLIEAVRGHRVFVPTVLAALCGLRRGEIAALRWKSIDLAAGRLSVVQSAEQTREGVRYKEPKRGRPRNVALSRTVVAELKAWRAKQAQELLRLGVRLSDDTLVCTTAAGVGIQPNSLTHEFEKAIEATDLPRYASTTCGTATLPTCWGRRCTPRSSASA